MSSSTELQASGYSLIAPLEPEPRNIVTSGLTESSSITGTGSAYITTIPHNTTGVAPEALENSANPADSVQDKGPDAATQGREATDEESGWHWADRAQVLRAHQRDSLHLLNLQDLGSDVARSIMGSRRFLANQATVSIIVKAIYYGLTFGLGSQTLGEEYVEVYPYVNRRRNFPSKFRRIISLVALIGAPQLFEYCVERLAAHMTPVTTTSSGSDRISTRRQVLLAWLTSSWIKALPELWFAWFLIKGRNVEWTKSLLGMSYITSSPSAQKPSSAYEPIGLLLLLPFINRALSKWRARREREERDENNWRKSSSNDQDGSSTPNTTMSRFTIDGKPVDLLMKDNEKPATSAGDQEAIYTAHSVLSRSELANPERQCPLCLAPCGTNEESGGTCVTECGHVFCWSCIQEWAGEKMECPLCRQALRLERLTPLYNL